MHQTTECISRSSLPHSSAHAPTPVYRIDIEYRIGAQPLRLLHVKPQGQKTALHSSTMPTPMLRPSTSHPHSHRHPSTDNATPSSSKQPIVDIDDLWNAALAQYNSFLNVDLSSWSTLKDLQRCSTAEQILDVLQDTSECLHKRRQGGRTSRVLRDVLKPVIHGLIAIIDAGADAASTSVRVLTQRMCV